MRYGAFVSLDGPLLLSRSPELFVDVDRDGWIETHPMKGTAPRGANAAEDAEIIAAMQADPKSQAENRMIVDLLRNDISRISEVGTLNVPKLFTVETYPTVHQMVSHVRAKLLPDISIRDIFAAAYMTPWTTGVIVIHNQPGGDTTPTSDDQRLTQRLRAAADVLDIRVHDYVIVGDHCYYSFLEAEAKAEVLFGH